MRVRGSMRIHKQIRVLEKQLKDLKVEQMEQDDHFGTVVIGVAHEDLFGDV